MGLYIPSSWFEPLLEWAHAPLLVGVFATFVRVVLWAVRQRRQDSRLIGTAIIVAVAITLVFTIIGI